MIEGEKLPAIRGERLHLRSLAPEDAPALFEIFSDTEVMRFWSTPPWEQDSDAQKFLEDVWQGFESKTFFQWGVCAADDRVIGTCTLWQLDQANLRCEIGFALARGVWGKGYMREALGTLFEFAFGDLGLRRLEADVDPDNAASIGLLERLGFQREGYLRERWLVDGKVADSVIYGLLEKEWRIAS